MTPLCALAVKHGTDKCQKHNYTPAYYERFKDRIASTKRLLEVGIKRGASLRMWEEFFPAARIYGIDHNPDTFVDAGRIRSFHGDQKEPASLVQAAKTATMWGPLDIIIDDGNHHWRLQLATARALLPYLAHDGIYVVEDVMMRMRNGVRCDDPKGIARHIGPGYRSDIVRTGAGDDDVLLFIRRGLT